MLELPVLGRRTRSGSQGPDSDSEDERPAKRRDVSRGRSGLRRSLRGRRSGNVTDAESAEEISSDNEETSSSEESESESERPPPLLGPLGGGPGPLYFARARRLGYIALPFDVFLQDEAGDTVSSRQPANHSMVSRQGTPMSLDDDLNGPATPHGPPLPLRVALLRTETGKRSISAADDSEDIDGISLPLASEDDLDGEPLLSSRSGLSTPRSAAMEVINGDGEPDQAVESSDEEEVEEIIKVRKGRLLCSERGDRITYNTSKRSFQDFLRKPRPQLGPASPDTLVTKRSRSGRLVVAPSRVDGSKPLVQQPAVAV